MKGFIIDRGNSPIDGKPYVAIMTMKSTNRKTGDMAQVFILREDVNPVEAIQTGEDYSICGNCPHRSGANYASGYVEHGKRSCYVNVGQAPLSVWRAYHRGVYKDATAWDLKKFAKILQGRKIRWGAYGDPSIIQPGIVHTLSAYAAGHTGYTHQWRSEFAQAFVGLFQASCDGFQDYLDATTHGWKTFVVVSKDATPNYAKQCPATIENSQAQCVTCSLCDGAKRDIYVQAHGTGAKYVVAA